MARYRPRLAAIAVSAGVLALGACASTTSRVGGPAAGVATSPTASAPASATGGAPSTATPSAPSAGVPAPASGPTSGWGPGIWNGQGSCMMGCDQGSWGPGMMGGAGMGHWWLAGSGARVQNLDQARARAAAFADRLGLHTGEVMQFSQNFYAELETPDGHPATEVLINPADGAVQIEYGPAMMWNTTYGMRYGYHAQAGISADQARGIAQQWLNTNGAGLTAGDPQTFPGYYTMDTTRGGATVGMLSVNASTGQVWNHTWHGTYIATSQH